MMPADPQGRDPKTLWQDQEPETDPVTLDHVHNLARRVDRKTRFLPLAIGASLLFVGFTAGKVWFGAYDPLQRVTAVLMAIGASATYFIVYRMEFPPRDPAEPVSAYLRSRLQRKLSYRQGGWVWAMLPLLPVILIAGYRAVSNEHGQLWPRIAPFAIWGAAWVFLAVRMRIRARQTRAQLQELDALLER